MESEEYYKERELTLRQKYVKEGVARAKREVALEKEINKLFMTKNELLNYLDKLLKPQI